MHELGHILFGCANGFKFNSVHIGFVKLYRKDGGLRLTVRELPEGLAGAAEMIPKRSDGLYARYLRMVFGGLFFSFLFLAGAVTAAVCADPARLGYDVDLAGAAGGSLPARLTHGENVSFAVERAGGIVRLTPQ